MTEYELKRVSGELSAGQLSALVKLSTKYSYFQGDSPRECSVKCPIESCTVMVVAVLDYGFLPGTRGADGHRTRRLQAAVREHLTDTYCDGTAICERGAN